jgi:hypothetical protein
MNVLNEEVILTEDTGDWATCLAICTAGCIVTAEIGGIALFSFSYTA